VVRCRRHKPFPEQAARPAAPVRFSPHTCQTRAWANRANCELSWVIPLYNEQDSGGVATGSASGRFCGRWGGSFELVLVMTASSDGTAAA